MEFQTICNREGLYIIVYLCIGNASRTGTLANMTCREFATMGLINHKTIAPSCVVNNIFSSALYEDVNIYYSKFVSYLDGMNLTDKSFTFFFVWNRKKMAFQIVTVQINYFWEWAVGHTAEKPRISGTIIQKVVVIKTHNECPELKKDIKEEREDNVNGERDIQTGFRNQQI